MASVTSKSAITPSFSGRMADDVARRAAQHALGFFAHGQHFVGARFNGDHGRFAQDDAVILDVNEGVGGSEVDSDVVGKKSQHFVNNGHREIC